MLNFVMDNEGSICNLLIYRCLAYWVKIKSLSFKIKPRIQLQNNLVLTFFGRIGLLFG